MKKEELNDGFEDFVSELVSYAIEHNRASGDLLMEWKQKLAEMVTEHPWYKKYAKGNTELMSKAVDAARKRLKHIRISSTGIYDAIQVYERFEDSKALIEYLAKEGKPLNWSAALVAVGRADSRRQELSIDRRCTHCPIHKCP